MIYKKRSITCYCIFQKNLLPLQAIIHSNQKKMTDILVLTLTLLIAWGAYTLVGTNSNEKSQCILSLAYIFCIMTAMEYYQGGIAGCIVILSISLALIFLRYLWKSGHKLPWTITLLAEWTFPIVFYNTLDRFSGLSSGICLAITLATTLIGLGIIVFIIFKQEK